MKVAAHPLVVAVALGLLGPLALADENAEPDDAPPTTLLLDEEEEEAPEAPTAEEFERVEALWKELTGPTMLELSLDS